MSDLIMIQGTSQLLKSDFTRFKPEKFASQSFNRLQITV